MKFALIERGDEQVVLLLDEPGFTIYFTAQAALLNFFAEKLAPTHQLIFSIHSPFMVPHDACLAVPRCLSRSPVFFHGTDSGARFTRRELDEARRCFSAD